MPLHPGFPSYCWQFDVTFTDCHSWKRKPSADTTPYCYAPIRITESNEHSEQFGSWHVVKSSVSMSYCSSPSRIPGSEGAEMSQSAPPSSPVHFLSEYSYCWLLCVITGGCNWTLGDPWRVSRPWSVFAKPQPQVLASPQSEDNNTKGLAFSETPPSP